MGFFDRFSRQGQTARQTDAVERDVFGRPKGATSQYMNWKLRAYEAEHTEEDGFGRRNLNVSEKAYNEGIDAIVKGSVPSVKKGLRNNPMWTMSAADREKELAAGIDAPVGMAFAGEYRRDVLDGKSQIADTGRHVTLSIGSEKSSIMMELEPDGDVHRFLDLEAPAGDPVLLELPHGSYNVVAEWGSSDMTDYGARQAFAHLAGHGKFETYTPPELRDGLDNLRAGVPVQLGGLQAEYDHELPSIPSVPTEAKNSMYVEPVFMEQASEKQAETHEEAAAMPGSPPPDGPDGPDRYSVDTIREQWRKGDEAAFERPEPPAAKPPRPETRVIDGRMCKDYGSGLYTRVALSMDETHALKQGDINMPSRYSVDDATARPYAVVDDAMKYMSVLAEKGAMAATARPSGSPDAPVHSFAQVDRDVAFVIDGPDGKREVQNIDAGGWMDYTDPKHPTGISDEAFQSTYALQEAHRLDPGEFQKEANGPDAGEHDKDGKNIDGGSPADGLG